MTRILFMSDYVPAAEFRRGRKRGSKNRDRLLGTTTTGRIARGAGVIAAGGVLGAGLLRKRGGSGGTPLMLPAGRMGGAMVATGQGRTLREVSGRRASMSEKARGLGERAGRAVGGAKERLQTRMRSKSYRAGGGGKRGIRYEGPKRSG